MKYDIVTKQAVVEDYPREQLVLGLQFFRVQVHHHRGCQADVHYPVHQGLTYLVACQQALDQKFFHK